MATGYSGTPLVRKLGIKAGMTCAIVNPPENYRNLLVGLPHDVAFVESIGDDLDFVHVFVRESDGLSQLLATLRGRIAQDGMIWVSWPKKTSKVATDLTGEVVRQAGLLAQLVDIKVCAVDEVWSGLKFVIPKADRR